MSFLPMKKDNKGLFPIGYVYISVSNVNPSTYFGGTWEAFATGRTLVGINPNDASFNTVEEVGGEKTHKLTTTEIPSHTHKTGIKTDSGYGPGPTGNATAQVFYSQTVSDTSATGGNGAHNNLQPYIVVYMWKRTA